MFTVDHGIITRPGGISWTTALGLLHSLANDDVMNDAMLQNDNQAC